MKKFIVSIIAVMVLSGCGDRVTVDSGRVAKQLGTNGLEKTIRSSGAFRLDSCITSACPRLVILDVFENTEEIPGKFYISKSKLDLTLTLSIQYAVREDDDSINTVYSRVKSVEGTVPRTSVISTEQVFETYIKPTLTDVVRSALNEYTIDEIMDNLTNVRKFVESRVIASYADSPVIINSLAFSSVSFPQVIVSMREEAASVDAEKITKMKRLDAHLEVASKQRELDLLRAKNAVAADNIVSKSMDKRMATWLMLEAIQTCADRETGDCHIDIHPALIPTL